MGDEAIKLNLGDNGNDPAADDKLLEDDAEDKIKHWKRHRRRTYNYFSLFRFATTSERVLLVLGQLAAIVSGVCMPLMIWLLGNLVRQMVYISLQKNRNSCKGQLCNQFYTKCDAINFTGGPFGSYDYSDKIDLEMYKFTTAHATVSAIYTVLTGLYFFCWYFPAEKQIARMQLAYFEALLRKDSTWSESRGDRDFANKIMENTSRIREGIGESIPMGISLHSMYIVAIVMSFCHGWSLTLVACSALPVMSFCSSIVSSLHARQAIIEQMSYANARSFAEEVLNCIQTVLVYGAQKKMSARYRKEISESKNTVNRSMVMTSLAIGFKWMVTFWIFALVLWYGLTRINRDLPCGQNNYKEYDAGDLIIIFFCVLFIMVNDGPVFPFYRSMKIATVCGRDVFWIIDTKSKIDSLGTDGYTPPEPVSGKIDFEDVRFTYPSGKNEPVLHCLNLSVQPGMKIGIVGPEGSGKSTVLNLILKTYVADSGFVKIDGVDIKSLNTHWLRSNIGIVSQDPCLFDDTIEQNIRMGKLSATFYEIQDACKKADAHDFIVSLKDGYQTKIGVEGNKLTASQRQRLAIARALIRNPKILLLDEMTTSLDGNSESVIMQTLEKVCKFRTVIIVAHRLQTVVNADTIYVFKRGRVVEKGTHLQMLKSKGPYSQLASGMFDGPSMNSESTRKIEPFDLTERNAINYLKLFNVVPIITNRYNNLLALDPVVEKVTRRYMIQRELNLKHKYRGRDSHYYTLVSERKANLPSTASILKIEYPTEEEVEEDVERQRALVESYIKNSNSEADFPVITFNYWKSLAFASKYKLLIALGTLASCVLGMGTSMYGILFGRFIARLVSPSEWPNVIPSSSSYLLSTDDMGAWVLTSFLILGIILGFASTLQNTLLTMVGYRVVANLRKRVFTTILQKNNAFFDDPQYSTTTLTKILDHDIGSLRYIVTSFYGTIIQCIVTIIVGIASCAMYSPRLTGYTIAMFPMIIGFPLLESWLNKLHDKKVENDIEQMSALILEVFSKLHTVATLQLEPYFVERLKLIQKRVHKSKNRYIIGRVITFALAHSSCFFAYTLLIYLGGKEMIYYGEKFETVITVGEILIYGFIAIGVNLSIMASFDISVTACEKIHTLLDLLTGLRNTGGDIVTTCDGAISLHNVHFWYPFSSDIPQLRNVTMNIASGSFVAIVGSSESGKSSFLPVLLRLYDVIGGSVNLDGKNIQSLNIPSYRSNFGVIGPTAQIFNGTVAENIAYGDNTKEVSMGDIIYAAKNADVHHYIVSLPDDYNTRIGIGDDLLSRTDKQRICVARALLREPSILLCQDIANQLDRDGEKTIVETLDSARVNRTCIVIAHRLFNIQKADVIFVMHEGEIVEVGTHKELLKNKGKYTEMWKLQKPMADENFRTGRMSYVVSEGHPENSRKSKKELTKKKEKDPQAITSQPQDNVAPPQFNDPTPTANQGAKKEPCGICNIFGQ